jgi:hypothetical protein
MFLFVAPVAAVLGQAPPPLGSWVIILSVAPALLAADMLDKRLRARRRTAR